MRPTTFEFHGDMLEREGSLIRRVRGNWGLSHVCAACTFILILLAVFGQWFHVNGEEATLEGDHIASWELDFELWEYRYFLEVQGDTVKDEVNAYSEYNPEDWHAVDVFGMAQILVILTLISALVMLIATVLVRVGRVQSNNAAAIGGCTVLLILVIVIYLSMTLPNALGSQGPFSAPSFTPESGFWGSETQVVESQAGDIVYRTAWGPGWAWYVTAGAVVFALIGSISLIRPRSGESWKAGSNQKGPERTRLERARK